MVDVANKIVVVGWWNPASYAVDYLRGKILHSVAQALCRTVQKTEANGTHKTSIETAMVQARLTTV